MAFPDKVPPPRVLRFGEPVDTRCCPSSESAHTRDWTPTAITARTELGHPGRCSHPTPRRLAGLAPATHAQAGPHALLGTHRRGHVCSPGPQKAPAGRLLAQDTLGCWSGGGGLSSMGPPCARAVPVSLGSRRPGDLAGPRQGVGTKPAAAAPDVCKRTHQPRGPPGPWVSRRTPGAGRAAQAHPRPLARWAGRERPACTRVPVVAGRTLRPGALPHLPTAHPRSPALPQQDGAQNAATLVPSDSQRSSERPPWKDMVARQGQGGGPAAGPRTAQACSRSEEIGVRALYVAARLLCFWFLSLTDREAISQRAAFTPACE